MHLRHETDNLDKSKIKNQKTRIILRRRRLACSDAEWKARVELAALIF